MSEQKDLIVKALDNVKETVDLFYQQKDKQAAEKLVTVIPEMSVAIDTLFSYKNEHDDFGFDEVKVCDILKEAMDALQNADNVLLADILQYDFVEYVDEIIDDME